MNIIRSLGALLVLWGTSVEAWAQQCAPGQTPYPYQYTPNGPVTWQCQGSPTLSPSQNAAPPSPPAERWLDRYGSIASDADRGIYESVREMTSVASAEQAALANCKLKGGRKCEVLLTYRNGCAAIVFGDTVYLAQTGSTVEAANQKALSQCSAATTNCRVEWNVCSLPMRIQ